MARLERAMPPAFCPGPNNPAEGGAIEAVRVSRVGGRQVPAHLEPAGGRRRVHVGRQRDLGGDVGDREGESEELHHRQYSVAVAVKGLEEGLNEDLAIGMSLGHATWPTNALC